jgi:hypothetical protein
MFDQRFCGNLMSRHVRTREIGVSGMAVFERRHHWFWVLYMIAGLVIAWEKHYITLGVLKVVGSALAAVFLWFLVLLGVNLHFH